MHNKGKEKIKRKKTYKLDILKHLYLKDFSLLIDF